MEDVAAASGDEVGDGTTGAPVLCRGRVGEDGERGVHARDVGLEGLSGNGDVVDLLTVDEEVVGAGAGTVGGEDLTLSACAGAGLDDGLDAGEGGGELDRVEREDGSSLMSLALMMPVREPFSVLMELETAATSTTSVTLPIVRVAS